MNPHLSYIKCNYIKFYIVASILFACLTGAHLHAQHFLGNDTLVCSGQYITLDAGPQGPYLWSTGQTSQTIRVYQDGNYFVNAGGKTDSINVTIYNESYNQSSSWQFGNGGSIQFDTSAQDSHMVSVTPLANSSFNIPAGSSSAVNNDGKLLFFTNGETIFDSSGNVLESGFSGDKDISQNSLIVAKPGSAVDYYMFTIKDNTLYYSIIHVNPDGSISTSMKNTVLSSGVDDKLSAINTNDGTGMWIMSHKENSNIFQAFQLTSNGISTSPVISATGTPTTDAEGYMKFSPDGTRLAIASDFTEVFYFDNSTGIVSFPKHLFLASSYGLEFSPNSNYLYVSSTTQTKTDSASPATPGGSLLRINLSDYQTQIVSKGTASTSFGALQLASNGSIYVAQGDNSASCLGAVTDPNSDGTSGYTTDKICISGTTALGLPNFPQQYFSKSSNFKFFPSSPCEGDSMHIYASSRLINLPYAKFSIHYDFGDPESRANDSSSILNPTHFYPGKDKVYVVTATTNDVCMTNVIQSNSYIIPRPRIHFLDTIICPQAPIPLLDAGNHYADVQTDYLWILGKDTLGKKETFMPAVSGQYRIEVKIGGQCDTSNLFRVTFKTFPPYDLGPPKDVCSGDTLGLVANINLATAAIVWSTGDSTKKIIVKTSGTYWVKISDQGCTTSDTVLVTYFPKPVDPGFSRDTIACFNTQVTFDALNPLNFKYKWNTGDSSESIVTSDSGLYQVTVYNSGCSQTFQTDLTFTQPVTFPLSNEYSLCEMDGQTIILDAGSGGSWTWLPGNENTRTIVAVRSGDYSVIKTDSATGCSSDFKLTVFNICQPKLYFPNAFSPNKDGENDVFKPYAKNVLTYQLNILNRWGELIFTSTNVDEGWDGTFKNEASPVDNYVYTVNYEGAGIKETNKFSLKGDLILLR
jgi:gliding motility-associated-like protein